MWWRSVLAARSFHASFRRHAQGRSVVAQDSKTQKHLGTSAVFCTKQDKPVSPINNTDTKKSVKEEDEDKVQAFAKKNLLNVIREMKVDISTKKKKLEMLKVEKAKNQARDLPENMERVSSMFQRATEEKAKSSKTLNPDLVAAASEVASSLPFDTKKTVSELLQLLKKHKEVTDARKNGDSPDISNIVSDMKIRKNPPTRDAFRPSNQIQFDEDGHGYMIEKNIALNGARVKRGLYSAKRLNIFTSATEEALETVTKPTLWDLEFAKEIAEVHEQPPRNGFEEMIQWTKEGKLWEFPINNEVGLDDDAEFYEHIFLDKYLADFPKEGPIRHFMELVTCGLSKNPYLSVKEKVEYIEWFRNYFKEKEELLKEIETHEKDISLIEREKL